MSSPPRLVLCALVLSLAMQLTAAATSVSQGTLQRLVEAIELSEEDADAALAVLGEMAERNRRRPAAFALIMQERANLLLREDRSGQAREELEAIFSAADADFAPGLRLILAQTLLFDDAPERALEELRVWRAQFERPDPSGLFLMGYAHVQLEAWAEAAEAVELAIELNAAAPRVQWIELLAYAYTRMGRVDRAIELLEDMIELHPDQPRWWRQLASNHLLVDRLAPGTATLWIASRLEDDGYTSARRLARLHAAGGMPAEGAVLLAAAIEARTEATDFEDWMLLGEMWMLARDQAAAVDAFERAAALGEDGEAQLMIAQLHVLREDYGLARAALRRALDAYGAAATPSRAWYLLAVVEIHLDDLVAAREALDRLAEDPAYEERGRRLADHIAAVSR